MPSSSLGSLHFGKKAKKTSFHPGGISDRWDGGGFCGARLQRQQNLGLQRMCSGGGGGALIVGDENSGAREISNNGGGLVYSMT